MVSRFANGLSHAGVFGKVERDRKGDESYRDVDGDDEDDAITPLAVRADVVDGEMSRLVAAYPHVRAVANGAPS